jgi:hypothetical protein
VARTLAAKARYTSRDACVGGGLALLPRALPHLLLCTLHPALRCRSGDSLAPGFPHPGNSTFNATFLHKVESKYVLPEVGISTRPFPPGCEWGQTLLQVFRLPVPEATYHHAHVTKNWSSPDTKQITELAQTRAFSSYHSKNQNCCFGDVVRTNVLLGSYVMSRPQVGRSTLGGLHG